MGEQWPEVRLGELVTIHHGWAFPSGGCRPPGEGNYRLIRIGDFARTSEPAFTPDTVQGFVDEYPQRFRLNPDDLLMAMTCQSSDGEILGVTMRVPDDGFTYLHNQRIGRIQIEQPGRLLSKYLEYLTRVPAFNRHLFVTASGSKILHTSPSRIEDFRFKLPPLERQQQIAGMLGALDDLIDTNQRLVSDLTELTLQIFQKRFADRPLTEPLGGLGTVVDCLHSKKPEQVDSGYGLLLQLNNINDTGLLILDSRFEITKSDYDRWSRNLETKEWDVVLTNVGRVGAVARIPAGVRAALGRNMTAVRPQHPEQDGAFIAVALLSPAVRREIEMKTDAGTILNALNVKNIPLLRLPDASSAERESFARVAGPMLKQADALLVETRAVKRVRDELLPLLMSGAVSPGEVTVAS